MQIVTFDHLRELPVLRRFYRLARDLFGVSVVMLSPDGKISLPFGERSSQAPFCQALQRQAGKELCEACDRRNLGRCARRGGSLRYHCFAGLTEFTIPMTLDGKVLAFLQCGQVLDTPPMESTWGKVSRRLAAVGVNAQPLRPHYLQMRVLSRRAQTDLIALLELIGDYVIRTQRDLLLTTSMRKSAIVARARNYVRQHLTELVTVEATAAASFTSSRNLCRVFRTETGQTVVEYVHVERTNLAQTRLRNTTDSCAAIAFACGFGSVQQFNRVFRQVTGVTPSHWRRGQESD